MNSPNQALKARIETFVHIIAICDDNPVGSRQLIGGELTGMRKALELLQPEEPYVGPGDGRLMKAVNNTPELRDAWLRMRRIVDQYEADLMNEAPPHPNTEEAPSLPDVHTALSAAKQLDPNAIDSGSNRDADMPPRPHVPCTQKESVLQAYKSGLLTGGEIANATGIKRGSVDAVMSMLRKEGLIPSNDKAKIEGYKPQTMKLDLIQSDGRSAKTFEGKF